MCPAVLDADKPPDVAAVPYKVRRNTPSRPLEFKGPSDPLCPLDALILMAVTPAVVCPDPSDVFGLRHILYAKSFSDPRTVGSRRPPPAKSPLVPSSSGRLP